MQFSRLKNILKQLLILLGIKKRAQTKGEQELSFWAWWKEQPGGFSNTIYEQFYTAHFGFSKDFYKGKRILDIGCGPMGSLEWAAMTAERIGLDPIADSYLKLGADKHKMKYVTAHSENMPFPDNYFDVICSFNSLDHVDNLEQTISEITRVLKTGGLYLLLADVGHDPTPHEPISFSFDITDKFKPNFSLLTEKHYEKSVNGLYESILANIPYDHKNLKKRYGIISAKFQKK